ncbi:MAG: SPOR domain-containing protein [Flavobacteriales bacterium]
MDSLRHASPLTSADVLNVLPGMFWDHDCVMLPGLGGFVCNPRSAWYDEAKRQIVPPSRDVLFNSRLTTNDGLVANELMAKHGITYREALKAVEGLVAAIQDDLEKGATVELPGLGKLYGEEDGQLRFMADVEFERMLRSFGHASIPLVARSVEAVSPVPVAASAPPAETSTPLQTTEAVPATAREPRVIPLRVKLGRAAAAVAIPLTLAGAYLLSEPAGTETLLGTNPLWNAVPVTATYAPLERPSLEAWSESDEVIAGETVQEFVDRTGWEGLLEFDLEAGRPAAGGLRIDVPVTPDPEPTLEPAPDVSPTPTPTPVAKPVEAPAPVNFLIVGGAFGVKENAEKLSATMEAEGFETSLHFQAHNGLTVVAMGGYATEDEARRALEDARARGHEKAWLKRL